MNNASRLLRFCRKTWKMCGSNVGARPDIFCRPPHFYCATATKFYTTAPIFCKVITKFHTITTKFCTITANLYKVAAKLHTTAAKFARPPASSTMSPVSFTRPPASFAMSPANSARSPASFAERHPFYRLLLQYNGHREPARCEYFYFYRLAVGFNYEIKKMNLLASRAVK